jgi:hypothetical protein
LLKSEQQTQFAISDSDRTMSKFGQISQQTPSVVVRVMAQAAWIPDANWMGHVSLTVPALELQGIYSPRATHVYRHHRPHVPRAPRARVRHSHPLTQPLNFFCVFKFTRCSCLHREATAALAARDRMCTPTKHVQFHQKSIDVV